MTADHDFEATMDSSGWKISYTKCSGLPVKVEEKPGTNANGLIKISLVAIFSAVFAATY